MRTSHSVRDGVCQLSNSQVRDPRLRAHITFKTYARRPPHGRSQLKHACMGMQFNLGARGAICTFAGNGRVLSFGVLPMVTEPRRWGIQRALARKSL